MPSSKEKTADQPQVQKEKEKVVNPSSVQKEEERKNKRKYLSQTDVPRISLNEALRIPFCKFTKIVEETQPHL